LQLNGEGAGTEPSEDSIFHDPQIKSVRQTPGGNSICVRQQAYAMPREWRTDYFFEVFMSRSLFILNPRALLMSVMVQCNHLMNIICLRRFRRHRIYPWRCRLSLLRCSIFRCRQGVHHPVLWLCPSPVVRLLCLCCL